MPKLLFSSVSSIALFVMCKQLAIASSLVHIGVTDSHPWAFENKQGELEGIYPALFESFNRISLDNVEFKPKLLPLKRILREMESTGSRLSFSIISFKPKRAEIMTPLWPIYKTPFVLVSRKDKPISKLGEILNLGVAMLLGGSECPCLGDTLPYNKITTIHHEIGLKMLVRGRVDAVAGPSIRLMELASQLELSDMLAEPLVYEWRTVWLWETKQQKPSRDYAQALRGFIEQALTNGQLEQLAHKYLHPAQTEFFVPVKD